MSRHQEVLREITEELIGLDPECSILVMGSAAHGEERSDSDIDILVYFMNEPSLTGELITEKNKKGMMVLPEFRNGVKIDIGWRMISDLKKSVPDGNAGYFYPITIGRLVRDPSGAIAAHIESRRQWLKEHPKIAQAWEAQIAEMKRHKADPSYPLKYNEQDFYRYLSELHKGTDTN